VVSAVGGSFSIIAVPTQLYGLTGSSASVGAAAAVSLVALVVASLYGGVLADVMDRRRLLLMAQIGLAGTYALLWAQAVAGLQSITVLLVLVACEGLSLGVTLATMGAAVPRVVPLDLLPAANSLSSLVRYSGAVVGPLLAGLLIPVVGLGSLYFFDALALLAVVWAVFRLPAIPAAAQPASASVFGQVLDGFRYLIGRRMLMAIISVDLAAMVFGMPAALYPELAARTYGGGLGLLYAAYPAGVFLSGLFSGTFTRIRRHGALMASAAIVWGATVVLLGLAAHLWLALLALVLGGAVNFVLSTFRNAISQAYTDDTMRGRIQGSMTVVLIGGPQVGGLLHGLAGATFGARWAIGAGGVLTVVAVLGAVRAVPELWRYRGE
jgi:MFS family permease